MLDALENGIRQLWTMWMDAVAIIHPLSLTSNSMRECAFLDAEKSRRFRFLIETRTRTIKL